MSVILECPQCEVRFRIKQVTARVDCPSCKINFKPQAIFTPHGNEPASQSPLPPPEQPSQPSSQAKAPRRLQSSGTNPGLATTDPKGSGERIEFNIGSTASSSVYPLRQKKNIWVTLVSWLLAAAAIGGLFAIISILGGAGDQESSASDNTSDDANLVPVDEGKSTSSSVDKALSRGGRGDGKKRKPELPPVDESPVFFSPREWEVAWNATNGYLVRLDVKTPLQTRTITGLIVDSRGWVITSLAGLKDAGEVGVTLAAKDLNADPPFRELTDLSRGIIATDPELDLALIAINPTQVIYLADINLDQNDKIVASQRLLIARTPPPRHRKWIAECRIDQCSEIGRHTESTQSVIRSAGLKSTNDLRWIAYPPRLPSDLAPELAGSPIIDLQGNVLAMNTGHFDGDKALAIPALHIRNFLDSLPKKTPQPQPFPRAADLIRQTTDGVAPEVIEQEITFEKTLDTLMKALGECRATDWTAELASEFAAMQTLAENLYEAQAWITRNRRSVEDTDKFEKLLDTAMEEIKLSLEADLTIAEFEAGKGNEFFETQVTPESPWFMVYAEVESGEFNSPRIRNHQSVLFKVLGTGKHVASINYGDARQFRRGRHLLLIGRLDPRGPIGSAQFPGEDQIKLVDIFTSFALTRR